MAGYDPRMYQMHAEATVLHPSMLAGMGHQRYPPHAASVPTSRGITCDYAVHTPNSASAQQTPNHQSHPTQHSAVQQPAMQQVPGTRSANKKQKPGPPGWIQTYRTAQSIAFPESVSACGDRVAVFLDDLARAIGCPLEYVLVPLLPCIGGLLGTNTTIRVHRGWSEPPILWSIVCASQGTRRSAVIRQLLAPLLALQSKRCNMEKAKTENKDLSGEDAESEDKTFKPSNINPSNVKIKEKRSLYSGTRINAAALTEVLHRNDGHAFSLTENVENLHEMLGILQPVVPPRLVSVMEDLYEGLPLVAVEDGRVTTILGSNFCHGGFSSPEYAVSLMLKFPSWLSSRLLVSCPQTDDMKGVFGEPASDLHQQPELATIYDIILRNHEAECAYMFSADAIQELSTFFDDEWSNILNQLDQNEHEGIIGKCMGQIVRISAVLKALENSVKLSDATMSQTILLEEWNWVIDTETVRCAITLGKYFIEQKLAITFMVGTGFFNGDCFSIGKNDMKTLPQTALGENIDRSDRQGGSTSPTQRNAQDSDPSQLPSQTTSQQSLSLYDLPKPIGPSGDIDYNNLPQTMTTLEEDVSEMMQAVDFVHFSTTQFVAVHGRRIKRLLECYDDGHGVSATTAAQKSITPPVRIEGTNNRHPAWASALFFQKVAELQLGVAEQGRHPTNRKVCWRFKRKPVNQVNEKNFQLLSYLRVDMEKYSQFGSTPAINPTLMVNAGLISLNQSGATPSNPNLRNSPISSGMDEDSNSQHSPTATSIKAEIL